MRRAASLVFRDIEFQCTDTVVEFTTFLIQLPSVDSETSNQSLQLTAGRRDDQFEFVKHIVDVTKARRRQR